MMDRLIKLEKEKKITIPEIFKDFCKSYTSSVPKNLVGTDLWNNKRNFNEDAAALLCLRHAFFCNFLFRNFEIACRIN